LPLLAGLLAAGCALSAAPSTPRLAARVLDATPTASPTAPPLSTAPLTVVAIGASDAFGIGTDQPRTDNWPTVLAGRLSSAAHLVNLGIPGATVALAQRDELPVALAAQPDVIAIFLGINDLDQGVALAAFEQQLTALLQALRGGTLARIYVANLPDLTLLPYFAKDDPLTLEEQVSAWNAAITRICTAQGVALVDLHAAWSELANHPNYVSADGLHPSTAGARRIAAAFVAAIESGAP
jgi:lysophospholipase L1-like esterase